MLMFCICLYATRMPAQTRVRSHCPNLRTFSWRHRSSLTISAETWDNWDETWQVRAVVFIGSNKWKWRFHIKLRSERTGGWATACQHRSWQAVWNNLHAVILSCGFVWKPPPACVTVSLWCSEVPTDRTSAQSGNIFTKTPPPPLTIYHPGFTSVAPAIEGMFILRAKGLFLWPSLRWNKRFPFLIPPGCFPLSLSVPIWQHQACQPHKPDKSRRGQCLLLHVCHYEWLHCFIPLCFLPTFQSAPKVRVFRD